MSPQPKLLDPKQRERVPPQVRELEKTLELSGQMSGSRSKEESNEGRIARYNYLMPLRHKALWGHPRYINWLNKFVAPFVDCNKLMFWLATIGRSSIMEWEEFAKHQREEAKKNLEEGKGARDRKEIHAKPVEPNWKKAMSSKLVRRWV